ncbi:MAG: NADPH:quinone oxidoreductase family protein [Alphaproteobacteria bacterium]|nr:MAG: NADPH:quinone oxidoreductase family protein [Alphaproteobacteria bacterium]
MRAVVCRRRGDPDVLTLETVARPQPGPGQIRIAVHAAGVNFADILLIAGKYQERPAFPFSPGMEAAGTVEALGPGVAGPPPGTRVLALSETGAFAEAALAPAEIVAPIPDEMDFVTAAALLVTYGTAHGALVWRADLKPGELLLVHGAAGGVGLAAVEVGKALGATVIATARGVGRLAVAHDHGADFLIDTETEDVRSRVKDIAGPRGGADVVFDPVGGDMFDVSLRAAAWGARLVVIGFASGRIPQIPANILLVKNISAIGFYWGSYRRHAPAMLRAQCEALFAWHAAGKIRPHVSHALPLERASEALMLLKERRSTGKVVLTVDR